MNADDIRKAGLVKITGSVMDSILINYPDEVEIATQFEYFVAIDGERYYYSQEYIDRTPYSGHVAALFQIVTRKEAAVQSHFEEQWNEILNDIRALEDNQNKLEHKFIEFSKQVRKEIEDAIF